jgi:hypothetical protein
MNKFAENILAPKTFLAKIWQKIYLRQDPDVLEILI